jgi:hypothetical protein
VENIFRKLFEGKIGISEGWKKHGGGQEIKLEGHGLMRDIGLGLSLVSASGVYLKMVL